MTKQERFESWFSTHPDFKVLADRFGNPFSREADGSYWLSVVRTAFDAWQAAQQKEGYALVPQSLLNRIVEICEEQANEWDSDAVVTHKNYAQCCGVLIRSLIQAAQEQT